MVQALWRRFTLSIHVAIEARGSEDTAAAALTPCGNAVDALAERLTSDALRRHGWADAGIWAPALSRAAARAALVESVAVSGDEVS